MLDSDEDVAKTVPMIPVYDAVAYYQWDKRVKAYDYVVVRKGELHDFPEHVITRYEKLTAKEVADKARGVEGIGAKAGGPRVLSPEDYAAWTNTELQATDPVFELTDGQLMALTADDLLAKLNSVAGLAERVKPLEEDRKYTRKAIVAHCDRLIAADHGEDVSLAESASDDNLRPSAA